MSSDRQLNSADKTPVIDSAGTVAVACLLCVAGALVFNVMPIVVGTAAVALSLGPEDQGLFASAYLWGATLSVSTSMFWIRRVSWRKTVLVAGTGALALDILAANGPPAESWYWLLFVLGAFKAILFSTGLTILGDNSRPARAFSISIAVQLTVASIVFYLVPTYITPVFGLAGLFVLFGAVVSLALLFLPKVPTANDKVVSNTTSVNFDWSGSRLALVGLLGMMMYFLGQSAVWAFLERIGDSGGLSASELGQALSISALVGVSGALIVTWIGDRFGRILPLAGGTLAIGVAYLIFAADGDFWPYLLAATIFNAAWNLSVSYHLAAIADADRRGNMISLAPAFQYIGGSIGPFIAGYLVAASGSFTGVYHLGFGATVVSLAIFWRLSKKKGL